MKITIFSSFKQHCLVQNTSKLSRFTSNSTVTGNPPQLSNRQNISLFSYYIVHKIHQQVKRHYDHSKAAHKIQQFK